jgi:hypothetical protein
VVLIIGSGVSFDKMQDWKGIRVKAGEVSSTKAYVINDGDFPLNSQLMLQYCLNNKI